MYSLKISPSILEHRLDSEFYNPRGLEATKLLTINTKIMPLSALVDPVRTITNGVRGPDWQETKYKLIRLQDCGNWQVNHSEAASISFEQFEENRRCRLKVNDIVVAIGGYVGNAAVLTEDCFAVIGQHSAILPSVEGQSIDSRFLLAYLNSNIAEAIFSRYVSGTVQAGINLEDLRDLPAPVIDRIAQIYIGDKVRQAEQLRGWAKTTVNSLQNEFIGMYKAINNYESYKRISYPVKPNRLFEVLTPASYPPHIDKYFEENLFVTLGSICSDIYIGTTLPSLENEIGVLQATSRSCSGLFFKQPMNIVEKKGKVNPLVQKDIILTNAAHDKNYIGKDVTFNHSETYILPSAKVVVIRLNSSDIPASYVHSYLMSDAGYTQWQAIVRGISAGIHPGDVARIKIPLPADQIYLASIAESADQAYIQAGLAQEVSRLLTIAAKNLVEALIEGLLTEDQLLQAQQALDDGDTSFDQAILSKLSLDGYAVEGAKPLFSDLDELYRLLESVQAAEEGNI